MGTPWNSSLPGISINTAYADANGDGYISDEDIIDGIINNYGQVHGQINEFTFPPAGQEGIHPPLEISSQSSDIIRTALRWLRPVTTKFTKWALT